MKLDYNTIKAKIISWFGSRNKVKIIVILGVAGVLLIFLSELLSAKKTSNKSDNTSSVQIETSAQIEMRLNEIISEINGVGRVKILVTLASGEEYVFATEDKNTNEKTSDSSEGGKKTQSKENTEKNIVIYDSSGGKQPLLKTTLQPKIQGVVIVCDGGDNPVVQERIISAVKTALNISTSQICVCKSEIKQ